MAKTKSELDPSKTKQSKKKKTKSLLSAPAAAAMKSSKKHQKQAKANPFEVIWSRKKFDVAGKKRKGGEERRVGQSRSLAIQKRKNTLEKEYEQSTKSSVFVDKRIGEKDDTLQDIEKAVLRLQRERQLKLRKGSKFNLDDGSDDDSTINQSHLLSEVDDFDEDIPYGDDEDMLSGRKSSSRYLDLHGGYDQGETSFREETEDGHKTKKQVMSEIILKSKFYKAQKAKDKEEDDHLTDKLDQDFASLAQKEALVSLTQPNKMNALKAIANKSKTSQSTKEPASSTGKDPLENEKPDAYDKLVSGMKLDMRARPSDRTKTPEEIAQEERERLEALEEERQKRMLGTEDSSDEENPDDEEHIAVPKKPKHVSGDDLGDSFSVDEDKANRKGWVDAIYENEGEGHKDSEGSESDEGDEVEGEDGDESEESDDDSGDELDNISSMKDLEQSDDDDDEMEFSNKNKESIDYNKPASEKQASLRQESLPFVIQAPNNLEEFCSLLEARSDEEVTEAINRIRACNSVKLAAENKKKMQVFYNVLLQYFAVLATQKPLNVRRINSLVKPLIEMTSETPYFAAICARERLMRIRARLCQDVKNPERSSWPSLQTLLRLRLWSLIFPCSDFRHVVMTPAILLMCEYLMRCPILSGRDIAIGSFLCSMLLSVAKQSQKFFPEAIIFLKSVLLSSLELDPSLKHGSQCHHLLELEISKPWLLIHDQSCEVHPVDFLKVIDKDADSPFFLSDNFKASIFATAIETLKGFVGVYKELSSFPEIFLPVSALLQEVLQKANLPSSLQADLGGVIDLIKAKSDEHHLLRLPLQMRKEKPAPLQLLNPKFELDFVKGRDYDPDKERAERKKLKKLLNKESKGAVRELRKDNHFIFGLKERDRRQEEEERAEKYGKARAFLQEQEHAFKSGQLGKGRKRRR